MSDQHVMIEYHDLDSTKIITHTEYVNKKQEITNSLIKLLIMENNKNLSKCIAINYDIKQYCIPILIAGIIETNKFFFYFKPDNLNVAIYTKLTVNLIFSHKILTNFDSILQLNIHDQTIYLLKNKNVNVKTENSVNFSSSLKFCYVISTSGTTGVPKIVKVTDKSIMSNIEDFSKMFNLSSTDKIAQLTPLTFDPSMIEIFLSIKNNCTLFMVSNQVRNQAQLLRTKMIDNSVTVYQTTPSLLLSKWSKESLKKSLLSKDSKLKVLLLGGEPFFKFNIKEIKEEGNRTKLFNVYGITEVSCWSSLQEIVSDETDCIGHPLSETIFEVRNKDKCVEDGQGLLYIGSKSRICLIDEEEVSAKSLPLFRNSGDIVRIESKKIYYVGRADATVKRLGNKVNLNKLENCAESNDMIAKCTAIWNEDQHKLCLFVMPSSFTYDVTTLTCDLRNHLKKSLENPYQPDKIYCMKSFPLTDHGKICKTSLEEIAAQREKPLENLKTTVQNLWQEHLGTFNDEGFLNLGGNSITALQMSNVLSDLLKVDFSGFVNILLNNSNFTETLEFVTAKVNLKDKKESNVGKENNVGLKKMEKSQKSYSELKCLWQKSRGDQSNLKKLLQVENIAIVRTFDLKKCVDASPTIFGYSDGEIFATVGSHSGIICTTSLNNSESYKINLPDRIEASVLVLDDFLGVVGCYDGNVYCLHLKTGDIAWKFQTGSMVKCSALGCYLNECLFVGSYDTYMYCLNSKTGDLIWRTKISEGSITAKPKLSLDQNLLFTTTLDGTCAALEVKSGKIFWLRKIDHPIFSAPAVLKTGHVVFCTVTGNLVCFDIHNNLELWTYSTKLNIFSYPIVHTDPLNQSENICVVAHDTFFCLKYDEQNVLPPTLRYKIKLKNTTFCTPWCEGNLVIIADSGSLVYVLNFQDGLVIAEIKLKGEIFSSPILHNDNVVIGCRDNFMYLLKIKYNLT